MKKIQLFFAKPLDNIYQLEPKPSPLGKVARRRRDGRGFVPSKLARSLSRHCEAVTPSPKGRVNLSINYIFKVSLSQGMRLGARGKGKNFTRYSMGLFRHSEEYPFIFTDHFLKICELFVKIIDMIQLL